jgi:hypothetical protein
MEGLRPVTDSDRQIFSGIADGYSLIHYTNAAKCNNYAVIIDDNGLEIAEFINDSMDSITRIMIDSYDEEGERVATFEMLRTFANNVIRLGNFDADVVYGMWNAYWQTQFDTIFS